MVHHRTESAWTKLFFDDSEFLRSFRLLLLRVRRQWRARLADCAVAKNPRTAAACEHRQGGD